MKRGYIGQRNFDRKTLLTLLFSMRRIRQFLLSKLQLSHYRPGGFQLAALKNQIFYERVQACPDLHSGQNSAQKRVFEQLYITLD